MKIESSHEERLKRQAGNVQSEVKDMRAVAKERHILFVGKVQKAEMVANLQVQAIRTEMSKEIVILDHKY